MAMLINTEGFIAEISKIVTDLDSGSAVKMDAAVRKLAHLCTLPPRPWRNVRMRSLASSVLCATAAIKASIR